MKKLKLQMLGLSVNDLLSREQMKKVMGGSGSGGSGGGSGDDDCYWCQCRGAGAIFKNPPDPNSACNSFCSSFGGMAYVAPSACGA